MNNQKMQNTDLKFDLFKLHVLKEDKDPKWSWIRASGKDLAPYIYSLMKELTNKNGTNNTAQKIKELLPRLSIESILNYFWSKYEKFPLVFLETLSKQFKNCEEIKQKIQDKIEVLSISRHDSKPIKALKELNIILCKLAGAHAADGALWGEYNYQLIDHDKLAVEKFCSWLEECFGYSIKPNQSKSKNAWTIVFKSRIIGRYLNKFLGFPIGKKCETVKEPDIIKRAPISFRKAYALGVLTFDGGIDCRGKVALHSRSKQLVTSVYEILKNKNIELSPLQYYRPRKQYYFQSRYRDQMLIEFFETNTDKWFRLNELVNGFQGNVKTMEEAKQAFNIAYPITTISSITFSSLLECLPKGKSFSYLDLLGVLKAKNINISDTTLKYYIKILSNNNIVTMLKKEGAFKIFKFNDNINEWKIPKR